MVTNAPACRARHLKQILASVDSLPDPSAQRIRAAVAPMRLREIEDALGLEWMPFEDHIQLTRAIHDVLGETEFRRFHRAHFAAVFRGPVFRAVVGGAAALYGFDPGRWMRLVPDAWTLTFRGCGTWKVDPPQPPVVAMTLTDLPRAHVIDRVWPIAVAAALSATLDVAGGEGAVELVSFAPETGEARFEMRWTVR